MDLRTQDALAQSAALLQLRSCSPWLFHRTTTYPCASPPRITAP